MASCGSGGGGDGAPAVPATPPGKLDASYGDSGKVLLPGTDFGMAVAADGSVYVTGSSIKRIDATGKASTFFAVSDSASFHTPVLDERGNLFAFYSPDRRNYYVVKIDASAQLVGSFGTNGTATLPFDPSKTSPIRLARDGQGNVYALGNGPGSRGVDDQHMVIAKLDASGKQVLPFGSNGIAAFVSEGHATRGLAIAADARGNVYIAGSLDFATPLVAKFDANGNLAADFGTGGTWTASTCATGGEASAIAIDASSNLFVTASCGGPAIFKIDPLGRTVDSFRDAGRRTDLLGGDPGIPFVVALRPDGRIYVGGGTFATSCSDFAVAKLDPGGNAAADFGSGGVSRFDVDQDRISDLGFDGQGRLYAAGPVLYCVAPRSQLFGYAIYRLGP